MHVKSKTFRSHNKKIYYIFFCTELPGLNQIRIFLNLTMTKLYFFSLIIHCFPLLFDSLLPCSVVPSPKVKSLGVILNSTHLFNLTLTTSLSLPTSTSVQSTIFSSSSSLHLLVPSSCLTTKESRAFSQSAPQLWNSHPPHLRTIDSLSLFKPSLKTHLFKTAFSPLIYLLTYLFVYLFVAVSQIDILKKAKSLIRSTSHGCLQLFVLLLFQYNYLLCWSIPKWYELHWQRGVCSILTAWLRQRLKVSFF